MSWEGIEKVLMIAVLLAGVVSAVLIHRRDGVAYRTICLDVVCYCGGFTLFGSCLLAIFGIYLSRSLDQSTREASLGWIGHVPVPVWCLLAVVGFFIVGGRWRYRIRHD